MDGKRASGIEVHLSEIQRINRRFEEERGWDKFPSSLVLVHLVEEVGEVGRHLLYEEGYKIGGMGHAESPNSMQREFAQCLSLLVQLANHEGVNLEEAFRSEIAIMGTRFPADVWKKHLRTYRPRGAPGSKRRKSTT